MQKEINKHLPTFEQCMKCIFLLWLSTLSSKSFVYLPQLLDVHKIISYFALSANPSILKLEIVSPLHLMHSMTLRCCSS